MTFNQERRNYPRADLQGEASFVLAGVVRNGNMTNLSRSGVQLECRHQLIELLSELKSEAGVYPDVELEFSLPCVGESASKKIKSTCNVSYCRRQRQDSYILGLNFVSMDEQDENEVGEYVTAASQG